MPKVDSRTLRRLAREYIWWERPGVSAAPPDRVIARVMDIGDFDFCSSAPLDRAVLRSAFPFLTRSEVPQEEPDTTAVASVRNLPTVRIAARSLIANAR